LRQTARVSGQFSQAISDSATVAAIAVSWFSVFLFSFPQIGAYAHVPKIGSFMANFSVRPLWLGSSSLQAIDFQSFLISIIFSAM